MSTEKDIETVALATEPDVDPILNRRVMRKVALHIIPLMLITNMLQLIDKSSLAYAALYGLSPDLGLVGQQYSLLGSIYYVGYIVFQYPGNILMQKFPASKVLGIGVSLWGGVVLCQAAVNSWGGLMAVRAVLGSLECFVIPGFVIM